MGQPKPLLDELASKGKPLAEAVVIPVDADESELIANILDTLSPDISADVLPAYFQFTDQPTRFQIRVEATREVLLREFGWELERIKVYDTKEDAGKFPDCYAWEEKNEPQRYPSLLKGKIERIGLTQPGNSDNGLIDDVWYESNQG